MIKRPIDDVLEGGKLAVDEIINAYQRQHRSLFLRRLDKKDRVYKRPRVTQIVGFRAIDDLSPAGIAELHWDHIIAGTW